MQHSDQNGKPIHILLIHPLDEGADRSKFLRRPTFRSDWSGHVHLWGAQKIRLVRRSAIRTPILQNRPTFTVTEALAPRRMSFGVAGRSMSLV